ncbi:Pre-mRNA-processing factor 19 [Cyberlindnera fabianii]|uniref:Pre-mRNA-processing factor 19 n=1 Tax=Cyberlindnera fabianii TaxID=36022 RepID=A0A1V2LBZ0_CYBFA|nr:Pre-mRNA-processing factor 19 [Cyberlindnera fabianii]
MQCASEYHTISPRICESLTTNTRVIVSGEPPKEPVVSPKSGALFERSLVEAYIAEHHKDPITSDELSVEDLIPLRATAYQQPRNATLNSVPSLLSALQNEWDATALELFQLRKQLDDTRKELSTALYHHDAAVRVAARAIKERDEARKALQELTTSISGGEPITTTDIQDDSNDIQMGSASIPEEISSAIATANAELLAIHKSQKSKPNVGVDASLSSLEESKISTKAPFKKISTTSITSDNKIYVTSSTGITSVYDPQSQTYTKDESITKNTKITHITKVATTTVIGFSNGEITCGDSLIKAHKSPIVALCAHPSIPYLAVSLDKSGSLALINTDSAEIIFTTTLPGPVVTADIHGDGALVAAAGVDGTISVIDLKTGDIAASFANEGQNSTMTTIRFGSNGYWLFGGYQAGDESYVLVWDLRKGSSSKIPLNYGVDKILLDKSSQICIVLSGGNIEISQFTKASKSWTTKAALDVDVDEDIVDGVVVDDSKPNVLELAVVTLSSSVKALTIS